MKRRVDQKYPRESFNGYYHDEKMTYEVFVWIKHIEEDAKALEAKNSYLENKLQEALNGNLLKRYNEEKEEAIAKNGELETWKNKAKEKMPAMEMKAHELRAKLEIAKDILNHIYETSDDKDSSKEAKEALAAINGEG